MHIETPKMAIRRLTGLSSTYIDAIYTSLFSIRGGDTGIKPDFGNQILGLTNYVKTSRGTLTGDNTSQRDGGGTTATWSATGSTDLIIVAVGTCSLGTGEDFTIGGTATPGISVRSGRGGPTEIVKFYDGTNTDIPDNDDSDTIAAPSPGDDIVLIGVRDIDTDIYGYAYNLTQDSVVYDVQLDSGTPASGAITPNADTFALDDWAEFFGGALFEFTAGDLPTTWQADMITMAQTLIAAKS